MPFDQASNSSWEDEPSDIPVAIGDILDGKYKIVRVLGKGGMGVVIAAEHVQLGHRVALKFLSRAGARNQETLARFALEAKAAAMMRSEHATRILDIGRLDNKEPYMVLEMLEGCDLGALVTKHGPLSITDAVTYVLEACEAIAEAHALGIVHRDLKPDNLFLATRPDGTKIVKVLDFGISKFSWASDDQHGRVPALTTTSAIIGSPMYMSPEQLKSTRDVDHRTDIWSIGVAFYELVSGQPPFPWRSMAELSAAILKDPPEPLGSRIRGVPPELDNVVSRCLEKNPDDRFDNIAELAWALAPFGGPHAIRSAERATELLARAVATQRRRSTDARSKRQQMVTQSDATGGILGKIIALPLGTTHSAEVADTSKQFRLRTYSVTLPSLQGLTIAIVCVFALLAVLSSILRLRVLDPPPNLIEARRGIADIAAMALAASALPCDKAEPRCTSSTPDSQQPATDTPVPADANLGAIKPAPAAINPEITSPARPLRTNPFADRE